MRGKAIRRRLIAALVLYGFAVGSALFWDDWELDWITMGTNLFVATVGLAVLHLRWRAQEQRAMTPNKARDIFS